MAAANTAHDPWHLNRAQLVAQLVHEGVLQSQRVIEAFASVPRHLFVPLAQLPFSYDDEPLPIGFGQTISQPTVVAWMTEALALTGEERVLEIGAGSGYQAAILSLLCREVYSIERIEPLALRARTTLQRLGYPVQVRAGDGYLGWPEAAPFDRIVVTAAPAMIPKALVEQLADGGILVAPVGGGGWSQQLQSIRKRGSRVEVASLGAVRFVPMLAGVTG
jgi:protein-L-isoaspartate(D-aspartate) O-methyltransferase